MLALQSLGVLLFFGINYLLFRLVGQDELGAILFCVASINVLSVLSTWGLGDILMREAASNVCEYKLRVRRASAVSVVFFTGVLISVLVYFSCYLLGEYGVLDDYLSGLLSVSVFTVPFSSVIFFTSFSILGQKKILLSIFFQLLAVPLFFLICIFLWEPVHSISVLRLYLVCSCFVAGLCFYTDRYDFSGVKINGGCSFVLSGIPMLIPLLGVYLDQNAGPILLGFWGFDHQIAFYVVALKLVGLNGLILSSVNRVVAPEFASLFARGNLEGLSQLVRRCGLVLFFIGILIFFAIVFWGDFLLSLFGRDFYFELAPLIFLALGQFVNLSVGPVGYLLKMTNNESALKRITVFCILLSLGLGFIFVPMLGVLGAAIMSFVFVVSSNLAAGYIVRKRLQIDTLNYFSLRKLRISVRNF